MMLHELIQLVELDIGEELAGEIADRQTAPILHAEQGLVGQNVPVRYATTSTFGLTNRKRGGVSVPTRTETMAWPGSRFDCANS